MLRSLNSLLRYAIMGSDGNIGRVHDFYFDDDTWAVRYMVAKTGPWLAGRKVLITTAALGSADWGAHTFSVALTREQIRRSPPIDTDKPVSRQQEAEVHEHFGWPGYWIESTLALLPPVTLPQNKSSHPPVSTKPEANPHLRSGREVTGYRVHASDGDLGRVKDFIADDSAWVVRYLVVAMGSWMPARKVLVPPSHLQAIDFFSGKVVVRMTQERIARCPEFHPGDAINRAFEEKLYDYYGGPVYWKDPSSASKGE